MINKIAEYGSELVYDFSFMYQDNIKPHYNNKRKVSYYLIRDDGYYVSFPSFFHTLPFLYLISLRCRSVYTIDIM